MDATQDEFLDVAGAVGRATDRALSGPMWKDRSEITEQGGGLFDAVDDEAQESACGLAVADSVVEGESELGEFTVDGPGAVDDAAPAEDGRFRGG